MMGRSFCKGDRRIFSGKREYGRFRDENEGMTRKTERTMETIKEVSKKDL
jgi:hypothetical protein